MSLQYTYRYKLKKFGEPVNKQYTSESEYITVIFQQTDKEQALT